ncbi:hypothetical protein Tco_0569293 [Tanacetum coccineum]
MGLPEEIYAAVDSYETSQEIWLHVQQMMQGSEIGVQEKKVKLFNEWERFTSTDEESIESYYHHLSNSIDKGGVQPERLAQVIDTPYSIDLNTPYQSVKSLTIDQPGYSVYNQQDTPYWVLNIAFPVNLSQICRISLLDTRL